MSCITGYDYVPYIYLDTILADAARMMAVIGVYNLEQLFAIEPDQPPRRVIRTLVERANANFSRHFPLFYIQKVNFNRSQATFRNNLSDYIAGTIQSHEITLVPDAVISLGFTSMITAKFGMYKFIYQPPTIILSRGTFNGSLCAKTICKYPLYYDDNTPSNDALYFMEHNSANYDIFIKQLVLDIGEFIVNLKNNYQLTNLPVEVFQGLENKIGDLRSELENLYNENPRNYLLFY